MRTRSVIAFVVAAFLTVPVVAQDAAEILFDSPSEAVPSEPVPLVINGQPVAASAWPATRKSSSTIEGGRRVACTATIIGAKVILTAAHCVADGAVLSIDTVRGRVSARCTHHPDYQTVTYVNDIALCLASGSIQLPENARYERLNTAPSLPRRNSSVIVLGFGCTQPGGHGSNNLVQGNAVVTRTTSAGIQLGQGSVLCEGDSGGAAYQTVSNLNPPPRMVIGVNSTRSSDFTHSTVTNVAAPDIAQFIVEWESTHGVQICGYSAPAGDCQRTAP